MKLDAKQREADETPKGCRNIVGFWMEGALQARRGGRNMQQIVEGEYIGRGQVGGGTSLDRGTVAPLDNTNETKYMC